MTTNAYIFAWDMYGIESIVPITQYEVQSKNALFTLIKDQKPERNPLDSIVQRLLLRARFNPRRNYEIYSIDCDDSLDTEFWEEQWTNKPQETAELIRSRGQKIFSDREVLGSINIT